MPEFQDFTFVSSDGVHSLHAVRCLPDGAPRAVVQIAHGIADYIDRYRDFMLFLAENGYLAVGNDHLGHGQNIALGCEKGFFAERDGWNTVVSDMARLHDRVSAEYPDIPYVMFGHSMGSFLTRTYLIDHPARYDAAILSGTAHQSPAMILGGYTLASAACRKEGPHATGYRLNDVAFGAYNKGFSNPRTKFDWISRDEAVVDRYASDPLCGFTATVGLFRDMMGGLRYITDAKNIARMDKTKPVYFMSGAADPVGENGRGVNRAYDAFCRAGLHDVMIRLYPEGRHEMLNEINRRDVYRDILTWLQDKVK